MITALDTSVLVDVLNDDPKYSEASISAARACKEAGRIVICDIVWAELAALVKDVAELDDLLQGAGVEFSAMEKKSATLAGAMWRVYRKRGGPRQRVIADFLVAAHAQVQCDQLLTRDLGFSRDYFRDLKLIQPK